jgi:hypothetical protein
MKRGREDDDGVERRPEKFQEIGSQDESEIYGSQEFSFEQPRSPFVFDPEPVQSPYLSDSESLSGSESPSGSQTLSQPGSPLTEYHLAVLRNRLDDFWGQTSMEFETAIQVPLKKYPGALKGQNETAIETVLSSFGSLETVLPYPPEPMVHDVEPVTQSFSTASEQVAEQETREKSSDVGEITEIPTIEAIGAIEAIEATEEVELDEETSIYISQTAEKIFDEVLKESLDSAIQKAKEKVSDTESSSQDLRLELLYDPQVKSLLDEARSGSLDDLKSEIWRLLQQKDMVEE